MTVFTATSTLFFVCSPPVPLVPHPLWPLAWRDRVSRPRSRRADADPPAVTKTPEGFVPNTQRKCRDTLCCLLFILFWIGMLVIAIIGFHYGSPRRLLYGNDYEGHTCGTGANKGSRYVAYPRNTEDYLINNGTTNPLHYKVWWVFWGGLCVWAVVFSQYPLALLG